MTTHNRRNVLKSLGTTIGACTVSANSVLARNGDDAPEGRTPLRAMSFNIHSGVGGDGGYNLRRIADVIEEVDPDVIGLQEVHDQYRAHWKDDSPTDYDAQHELLADWLDMNHVAVAAVRDYGRSNDPSWTEEEEENGYRRRILDVILSKRPILESSVYTFDAQIRWDPPHQNVQQRVLLETKLNVNGSHIWFYNTHLHSDQKSDTLAAQAEELADIAGQRDGPQILVGDFNFLDGRAIYSTVTDAYRDLLKEIGEDEGTYPATYDPGWGPLRLDYIFGTEEVTIEGGKKVTYGSGPAPSDHYPVFTDVTVPRGNRGDMES